MRLLAMLASFAATGALGILDSGLPWQETAVRGVLVGLIAGGSYAVGEMKKP